MEIPVSDTMKTMLGLIGLMTLGITVLTFVHLVKKTFGRTPPIDDQFKKVRSEIYETTNRAKKEIGKDISALQRRADEITSEIEEIKLDRERKWNELRAEYHTLELTMAKVLGRLEEALKKLD